MRTTLNGVCHLFTQKYNLSVSTYVEKEDISIEVDIDELNERIANIVARQNVMRAEIDELIKTL